MNEFFSQIGLFHYLVLSSLIFTIGVSGVFLNRRNIINILMSIELVLLSVNINFVAFTVHFNQVAGYIFSICILTVAAAEAAIGLAILVVYNRNKNDINVSTLNKLRG